MTAKQRILKMLYPVFMRITKLFGKGKNLKGNNSSPVISPLISFFDLLAKQNDGAEISFSIFKGKKVLLVNTASDCGYTGQYAELQKLYELYKEKLIILAFPANDFKEQEKRSDDEIARFCTLNYGITFPLMKKSVVVKSPQQNPVYQWLTDTKKNGWCHQAPEWNFSKYLVDETGFLTNYFAPSVSPLSKEVTEAILR